jgi:hypothetical protein
MLEILRSWLTYLYQKINVIAISGGMSFDFPVNKKTQPFGRAPFFEPRFAQKASAFWSSYHNL